jgi:low affinity Fe/Cu permease
MEELFHQLALNTSQAVGKSITFLLALTIILLWALSGPFFNFSDTWQLVINTSTTIVTFLMVFLIQNTQNRDAKAIHLKLDELIKGVSGARTEMVNLEELSDEDLEKMHQEFRALHERASQALANRQTKSGSKSKK